MSETPTPGAPAAGPSDEERRFGGLRRLYGDAGYERLRAARVAVVGLGGVGSWAVEALGRSGVALLRLVDLDHVAESNIHRQIQATGSTLGRHKGQALAERLADVHPGGVREVVDAFIEDGNVAEHLAAPLDAVIDACDDGRAKLAIARWCLARGVPLVVCGAAGGKRMPHRVEVADLAAVTHDPLLARLRQRLRRAEVERADPARVDPGAGGLRSAPRGASGAGGPGRPIGLACVFSREPVALPTDASGGDCAVDGSLNCAGYGSTVAVTGAFGLAAAGWVIERLVATGVSRSMRERHATAPSLPSRTGQG